MLHGGALPPCALTARPFSARLVPGLRLISHLDPSARCLSEHFDLAGGPNRTADSPIMTPLSVLIADDDAAFRETLGSVLEPLGVRGCWPPTEKKPWIVHHEKVHLVLLDMHMPRLTGLETLRRLKQFKAVLPCILLSARLDEQIVDEARRAHAFSIMSKPVTRVQITTVVGRAPSGDVQLGSKQGGWARSVESRLSKRQRHHAIGGETPGQFAQRGRADGVGLESTSGEPNRRACATNPAREESLR